MVRKNGISRSGDREYGDPPRRETAARDQRWLQRAPTIYGKLFKASLTNPKLVPMRERFVTQWQQVSYRVYGGGGGPYGNNKRK